MKKKKIAISIILIVIIMSIVGCSKNELLTKLNNGKSIEIEVSTPENIEQGTQMVLEWTALDQLDSYSQFRTAFDDALKIVAFGNNSKCGIAYVDLNGNQCGNNTLYNSFMNRKFISEYWENKEVQKKVQETILSTYIDLEDSSESLDNVAKYAALNAYYNIISDSDSNYFNQDRTITRGEFIAAVVRAETPVTESGKPEPFIKCTTVVGEENEYTPYLGYLINDLYLGVDSGSLDSFTYNGVITRGEAIYTIVQKYFIKEYDAVDDNNNTVSYSDVKNGGNIAKEQKFIEDTGSKPHWKAYELTYALQNPDKGCPESMYEALVVAKRLRLLGDSTEESRWYEGLTKSELIELLTRAYRAIVDRDGYIVDAMMGKGDFILYLIIFVCILSKILVYPFKLLSLVNIFHNS